MQDKKDCILESETGFAYELSAAVFEKPKLSVWMILIPIILVFHIYRHQRYVDGRRAFAENYLITRKRALEAAFDDRAHGKKADLDRFGKTADVPSDTRPIYRQWVALLIEHYQTLISSEGQDYKDLVRDGYKTRTNYLLFINRLNQAEKQFNRALQPHIRTNENGHVIEHTIARIEQHTEILRRRDSETFFA